MPTAILTRREPVGGALHRVVLEVAPDAARAHVHHGQYVEVRPRERDAKGLFVLASSPGSRAYELVVKPGGAMADRLLSMREGTELWVSEPLGRGFPLEASRHRPLLLAATGSGLAAVLSCLRARAADGDGARTYLVYGVRERRDVALEPELSAARAAGIEVAVCLSREHSDEPGFFRGYVQHVAMRHGWALADGKVFAAGSAAMLEGMRELAPSLGLTAADVFINS